MFTDPYSGKFSLGQGVQQLAPLLLQYMLMQKAFPGQSQDSMMAGARAQGMASMMPGMGLEQAQPMSQNQGSITMGQGYPSVLNQMIPGQQTPSGGGFYRNPNQPMGTDENFYRERQGFPYELLQANPELMKILPFLLGIL